MKIVCEKDKLIKAINSVVKAVASKTTMPILEGILIQTNDNDIKLTTYDLEIGIEYIIDANVVEQGSTVVNAIMFSEIIRKLPDTEINIQLNENKLLVIECEGSLYKLATMNPEEFPELPKINIENSISLDQKSLKNMIRKTIFGVSIEENRPIFTGCLFEIENNKIKSVKCSKKIETDAVILAIGHSARDTFKKLYEKGVEVAPKNFAVGVRIEHLQKDINRIQYGKITKLELPSADYKLVYHAQNGRTCYTFCMCPGGQVMASNSEENSIVTNGMSNFARDGENANSALLVNVVVEDFYKNSPLDGMYFQEELEKKAFELGGKNYNAPIQKVGDFIKNIKTTEIGKVKPTYKPGVTMSNLNEILPEFVSETLKEAIPELDKKLKGFGENDALLTGVETRSSSPVQITRDKETLNSINVQGLYPCGEGAGYAGGIMTAAIDGIKCAIKILEGK